MDAVPLIHLESCWLAARRGVGWRCAPAWWLSLAGYTVLSVDGPFGAMMNDFSQFIVWQNLSEFEFF